MNPEHRALLFLLEMVVASFGSRQKPRERHVFSIRKPLFRRRFLSETQWLAHDDAERAHLLFLQETHGCAPLFCRTYNAFVQEALIWHGFLQLHIF